MKLAYCLGQSTIERIQKLHLMSSTLGLKHHYIWLDCHQDLVEALRFARPDLIVAYTTEPNPLNIDLENFLLENAPDTSPIIVYSTDDRKLDLLGKNRRLLALNENWNTIEIKSCMLIKAAL